MIALAAKFISNYCIFSINIINRNPCTILAVKKLKTSDVSSRPNQADWFEKYCVIERNKWFYL